MNFVFKWWLAHFLPASIFQMTFVTRIWVAGFITCTGRTDRQTDRQTDRPCLFCTRIPCYLQLNSGFFLSSLKTFRFSPITIPNPPPSTSSSRDFRLVSMVYVCRKVAQTTTTQKRRKLRLLKKFTFPPKA